MSPLRRAITGLVAVVATVTAVAAVPTGAQAQTAPASITEVGWWSRNPSAAPQPAGGFEVAEGPDDDISVAALRVRANATLTRAVLVVREASGVRADMASLRVCVTTATWTAANPGPFEQRPAATCGGGGLVLARSSTGGAWSADVRGLMPAKGATTSLMIVPGPSAAGLPVEGFQVVFSGSELDVTAADDEDEDDGSTGGGTPTSFGGSSSSDGTFSFGFGGTVDTTIPAGGEELPATGTTFPSVSGDDGNDESAGLPLQTTSSSDDEGAPWSRLPLLFAAAAALGAVAGVARKALRDAGLLSK